jgi:hypothetical protein
MEFLHNPEREKEQNKISLRTKAGLIAEMMEHGPVYSQVVLWERTCASGAAFSRRLHAIVGLFLSVKTV